MTAAPPMRLVSRVSGSPFLGVKTVNAIGTKTRAKKPQNSCLPRCPFCQREQCRHLIGWTEDGQHIVPADMDSLRSAVLTVGGTDRIVTTGVSARVYRLQECK